MPTYDVRVPADAAGPAIDTATEVALRGGPVRYTLDEMCARVGTEREPATRLWMALGFPIDSAPDDAAFTDGDVEALAALAALGADGVADDATALSIARSLGHSMARVAEWEADVLTTYLANAADPVAARGSVAEHTLPALAALQSHFWRRHLADSICRTSQIGDSVNRDLAIGFADMVGYTRLTRHLDSRELTELIEAFESDTAESIAAHGGWVIKNVGDEVMFASEQPAAIAEIAFALAAASRAPTSRDFTVPELRIGLAYGPVVQRFGDVYGTVVNTAARLTGVAYPGTVLVDAGLADALADDPRYKLRSLRPVSVKGISRLAAHVLRRSNA